VAGALGSLSHGHVDRGAPRDGPKRPAAGPLPGLPGAAEVSESAAGGGAPQHDPRAVRSVRLRCRAHRCRAAPAPRDRAGLQPSPQKAEQRAGSYVQPALVAQPWPVQALLESLRRQYLGNWAPEDLGPPRCHQPDRPVGAPAWTKVHYARVFAFNRVETDWTALRVL